MPNSRQKCLWWWLTRPKAEWLSWSLGNLRKVMVFRPQWKALIYTQASSQMMPSRNSRPVHSLTYPKTLRTINKNMWRIVRIWWPWIPSDPKTHSNMSLKILISFSLSIQYFIILLLLQNQCCQGQISNCIQYIHYWIIESILSQIAGERSSYTNLYPWLNIKHLI